MSKNEIWKAGTMTDLKLNYTKESSSSWNSNGTIAIIINKEGKMEEIKAIKTLAKVEEEHIMEVLKKCNGNKMKTARALGISTKTLYNKLDSYKIEISIPHN